ISMMQAQMKKVERIKALIRKMQKAKNDSRGKITAKMSGTPGAQITGAAEMVAGAESGAAEALMNELMNVASSNEAVEKKNNSAWTQIVSSSTALASAGIKLGEKIHDLKKLKEQDNKNNNKDATLGDKDSHFFAKGADGKIKGGKKFGEKVGALFNSAMGKKETGKDSSGDGTTIQGESGTGGENSPSSGDENDANRLLPGVQDKEDITLQGLSSPGATTSADIAGGVAGAAGTTVQFMGALFGGGMTEGGLGGYFKNLGSSFVKMLGGLLKSAFLLAKGLAGVLNGDMLNWGSWAKPPDSPQAGSVTETPGKPSEGIELGTPTSTTTTETGEVGVDVERESTSKSLTTSGTATVGLGTRTQVKAEIIWEGDVTLGTDANGELDTNAMMEQILKQDPRFKDNDAAREAEKTRLLNEAGNDPASAYAQALVNTCKANGYNPREIQQVLQGVSTRVIAKINLTNKDGTNQLDAGMGILKGKNGKELKPGDEGYTEALYDNYAETAGNRSNPLQAALAEQYALLGLGEGETKERITEAFKSNTTLEFVALKGSKGGAGDAGKQKALYAAMSTRWKGKGLENQKVTTTDETDGNGHAKISNGGKYTAEVSQQIMSGEVSIETAGPLAVKATLEIEGGQVTKINGLEVNIDENSGNPYVIVDGTRIEVAASTEGNTFKVSASKTEQISTGELYKLQVEGLGDVQFKLDTAGNLVGATINGQDVTFDLDNNKVKV
ncbi:hypothetical protein NO2_1558, partial [Candidatus Termititenax persephonae]